MKLFVSLFMLTATAFSVSAWAGPVRTSNPNGYAQKVTLDYGREQSDWDQAKIGACNQKTLPNGALAILCSGETRIMGPGGGGSFNVNYECKFLFAKETSQTYIETQKSCQ